MRTCLTCFAATLLLIILIFTRPLQAQAPAPASQPAIDVKSLPEQCFLFCSFRGNGDGLHLAWSTDGLKWTALNDDRSYLTPTVGSKLMRDPCITQGPDGTFQLVYTTGWWDKVIGHASSKDLIHWSEQQAIPVMEQEANAKNSWAPEIVYDASTSQYMIYWATTIPGRFKEGEDAGDKAQDGTMLNHRIYYTLTKDFKDFSPTKLLFNPGYSVIDSTIIRDDASNKYFMVFKDETRTPPKKNLHVASSDKLEGPYGNISEPFTPAGVWVEGPSLFKVGDWYYCYFDMYRDHKYGAMRTKDMKSWENITPQLSFSVKDIRHGTAFKVSRELLANLLNSAARAQP